MRTNRIICGFAFPVSSLFLLFWLSTFLPVNKYGGITEWWGWPSAVLGVGAFLLTIFVGIDCAFHECPKPKRRKK